MFEILGEFFNPGPVGKIEFTSDRPPFNPKWVWVRLVFALALVGLFEYFVWNHSNAFHSWEGLLTPHLFFLLYLAVSYFVNIKPNYSNTGWVPFLVNNPFRISDNINRLFVILEMLSLPGRFIFLAILQGLIYIRYRIRRN